MKQPSDSHFIPVTKCFLPPFEEYTKYLERIWASGQITNNGPLVQELEAKLKDYLGVKYLFFVSNGTIALQIAIKAAGLQGEIITTPFSYVATTSSIVWEGCQPVFVDIDPYTLCINPDLIEAAITEKTTGILATHVYGIPCAVEQIKAIANNYALKVIYDAAHTFGGKYKDKSIVSYGDIATLSLHATKVFHTVEGGVIVTEDDELAHRIGYMRNFGHKGQEDFWGLGINGKNSEFHAAMGLCNLPYVNENIESRRKLSKIYDELIGEKLSYPIFPNKSEYNYAYFPSLFKNEEDLLSSKFWLNEKGIYPRRYFYPTLSILPYIENQKMVIADDVSRRVLCLPLYNGLDREDLEFIVSSIFNK